MFIFFIFCGLTHHPPPATRHPPPVTRHPRKSPAGNKARRQHVTYMKYENGTKHPLPAKILLSLVPCIINHWLNTKLRNKKRAYPITPKKRAGVKNGFQNIIKVYKNPGKLLLIQSFIIKIFQPIFINFGSS